MTWQLISSIGFKAIYTRLPAAAQEGAPLVNVAHNFETERHPHSSPCCRHCACTCYWKSCFKDEDRDFWCLEIVFDVLRRLQEELWNAITHGLMFFLSLFGTGFLMYKAVFLNLQWTCVKDSGWLLPESCSLGFMQLLLLANKLLLQSFRCPTIQFTIFGVLPSFVLVSSFASGLLDLQSCHHCTGMHRYSI